MRDFWEMVLPYHVRYQLLSPQVQQMWLAIQPHRNVYDPSRQLRVAYHIGDPYQQPFDALLRGELPPRYRYRHFTIAKKDGTRRHLAEPGIDLKAMQHTILAQFLEEERPHPAAIGYRKGLSIADHAWAHAGARTVVTADIQDFFPSTTRYRVRQFWRRFTHWRLYPPTLNDNEVQLLTNLTTYLGALPQGAPTSPALSNVVNRELDARLHRLATESGGHYTRYADDLVFSWQTRPRPPTDFAFVVRRTLREHGYRLHPRKGWGVFSRADEPEITGVVLTRDGGVDVPRAMRRLMDELARSDDLYDRARLAGYRGYRQMVRRP